MPSRITISRHPGAALPAAVIGSLALSLAGTPAQAATSGASPERVVHPTRQQPDASAEARAAAFEAVAPTARHVPASYRVVRGDTVSRIAARFGLRTVDVLSWNSLTWSTVIYPGQQLRLRHPAAQHDAPKPAKAAAPAPTSSTYVVRAGDTVSAIARRHGQPAQTVLTANGLRWSSVIFPGQKLRIPGSPAVKSTHAAHAAPAPREAANKRPAPTSAGSVVVRAGDTMSAIAGRHGVSVTSLLQANGMDWSSIIYPGQRVRIPASGVPGLTTEQAANARRIVTIGHRLGVPKRGLAIALGTAMQESGLRNLDHGDRDSLGLFQQRPSTGWGTRAQVRDVDRSIRAFFGGPNNPNAGRTRGLLDVRGWQRMPFADAAQAVQVSAYPHLYAQWEKPATAWVAAILRG